MTQLDQQLLKAEDMPELLPRPRPSLKRTMDLAGQSLGKYRIHEEIGRGSISTTFRATNTNLGKPVALKVLNAEFRNEPLVVSIFHDKAQSGAMLNHPGIAPIHDLVVHEDLLFLVTDFIEGQKLNELVEKKGPYPPREGLRLLETLTDAMAFAHAKSVVHHNIKPHNIIIEPSGRPIIIDFGMAMVGLAEMLPGQDGSIGRVRFMSPEEIEDREVDFKTDLWSLGVTAYYLFTGHYPFDGETPEEVKEQIRARRMIAYPTEIDPRLPKAIDQIIVHLLSLEPHKRDASAMHVKNEISSLLAVLSDPNASTASVTPVPSEGPVGPLPEFQRRDIGHYHLFELKGAGSFAMVYMAEDQRSGRLVALKLLKPEFGESGIVIDRFRQEAEFAQRIRHPNVVDFYEFGVAKRKGGKDLYFTMEYIEGPRLKDLIEEGRPIPVRRSLEMARQVALGLNAAHEVGIIHRDLKPANILLDKTGEIHIADFGIAVASHLTDQRMTETGQLLGTYAYMSPEQAKGEEATQASDVYSFGVILYEMLTSRLPFENGPPLVMLKRIAKVSPAPFPKKLKIPSRLQEFVMQLLAKRPEERFQSAEGLAEAIVGLKGELA
jgi:serine/threonine protein kinase